jgi:CheY-like chemotaxis protein
MPRILVIDDEPAVCSAIRTVLEQEGYTVIAAEGGHGAVEAIEAFAFDAVVVDIFMPDMDGLQTIRIFHETAPEVPIIAMSGYAFRGGSAAPDFFGMARELGAACCLRKPFRPRDLVHAIEQSRLPCPA